MKTIFSQLSVIVAALSYGYITYNVSFGTGEGLSFTTFILWSALASIACYNLMKKKTRWGISMMYAFGATSVAIALIYKNRCQWSTFDTVIAILVMICIYLSKTKGATWGLVASVTAGIIAAIPFILLTWQNPEKSPIIANSGFMIGNTLCFLSGKTWTLDDRLYGGANAVACILLVLPWMLYQIN